MSDYHDDEPLEQLTAEESELEAKLRQQLENERFGLPSHGGTTIDLGDDVVDEHEHSTHEHNDISISYEHDHEQEHDEEYRHSRRGSEDMMEHKQQDKEFPAYKVGMPLVRAKDIISCCRYHEGLLYFGSYTGEIIVWDASSGHEVNRFVATLNDKRLAITCMDVFSKSIQVDAPIEEKQNMEDDEYDMPSQTPQTKVPTFIQQIKIVLGSTTGEVSIWDTESRSMESLFKDHTQKVSALKIVDDCIYTTSHDGYFLVRDAHHGRILHSFITCTCPLSCMAVENANVVYIGSWDGCVKRIDLMSRSCTLVLKADQHKESPIRAICIGPSPAPPSKRKARKKGAATAPVDSSSEGETFIALYVAHGIGHIKSWDMRTGKLMVEEYLGHTDVVNALLVYNGRLYSGSDDRTTKMFDVKSGVCIESLTGHENGVTCLTVHGDDLLISGGFDAWVRQYEIKAIDNAITLKMFKLEEGKQLAYEQWLKARARKGKGSKKKGSKKGKKGKSTDSGGAKKAKSSKKKDKKSSKKKK